MKTFNFSDKETAVIGAIRAQASKDKTASLAKGKVTTLITNELIIDEKTGQIIDYTLAGDMLVNVVKQFHFELCDLKLADIAKKYPAINFDKYLNNGSTGVIQLVADYVNQDDNLLSIKKADINSLHSLSDPKTKNKFQLIDSLTKSMQACKLSLDYNKDIFAFSVSIKQASEKDQTAIGSKLLLQLLCDKSDKDNQRVIGANEVMASVLNNDNDDLTDEQIASFILNMRRLVTAYDAIQHEQVKALQVSNLKASEREKFKGSDEQIKRFKAIRRNVVKLEKEQVFFNDELVKAKAQLQTTNDQLNTAKLASKGNNTDAIIKLQTNVKAIAYTIADCKNKLQGIEKAINEKLEQSDNLSIQIEKDFNEYFESNVNELLANMEKSAS